MNSATEHAVFAVIIIFNSFQFLMLLVLDDELDAINTYKSMQSWIYLSQTVILAGFLSLSGVLK